MKRRNFFTTALALIPGGAALASLRPKLPRGEVAIDGPYCDVWVTRRWIEAIQYPWASLTSLLKQFIFDRETGWKAMPLRWRLAIERGTETGLCLLVPPAMWQRLHNDPGGNHPKEYAADPFHVGWFSWKHDGGVDIYWRGIHIIPQDVAPHAGRAATFRLCERAWLRGRSRELYGDLVE